jgi:hypothetical protein
MPLNRSAHSLRLTRRAGGPLRRNQWGQAMTEYIVIGALALIILLVVPVPGLEASGHNMSVIGWMIYVLHQWWVHYSYLISFP